MKHTLLRHRRTVIYLVQLCTVLVSLASAFLLRFEFDVDPYFRFLFFEGLPLAVISKLLAFHLGGLDRGWWSHAGMPDLIRIAGANVGGSAVFTILTRIIVGAGFPRSIYILDFLLCFVATAGLRFVARFYRETVTTEASGPDWKRALIYGAGASGVMLLREIRGNSILKYDVIGFVDDDPHKVGTTMHGLSVRGRGEDVAGLVPRLEIDEILIAMPTATGRQMQRAVELCTSAGVHCRTIPSLGELITGKVLSGQVREISLEDLLGREPVRLEQDRIRARLAGRSIMVTGAGGSIGSELCRQVSRYQPRALVAFERSESDLFSIDLELKESFPRLAIFAEIGDICDGERVREVMARHSVDSVFHAAAYKHVPMMEANLLEAVKNNILGTYSLAMAATETGISSFVMISSDKAVRPASVMGATKRVAEMIVSSMNNGPTSFVSLRFGNVLGSKGSVIPLFKAQIASGGPVTVTHPEMRRYFMTTPEAVQLVLQASTMGQEGEIFVLEMGEQVRIVDLAENLIRLSGLEPGKDIRISFIGPRPGEKICEELMTDDDTFTKTYHEKIKIFRGARYDLRTIQDWMLQLQILVEERDAAGVVAKLQQMVPDYRPSQYVLQAAPRAPESTSEKTPDRRA